MPKLGRPSKKIKTIETFQKLTFYQESPLGGIRPRNAFRFAPSKDRVLET